jgi:aldehyde:ferredoxin oxidoreductase
VWNNDRKVIFHANYLCNGYGLDVGATGNIISFLMELHHRGRITEKDTDGIPMRRGDEKAIIATIHKIAKQEGFGELFRNGVLEAARKIGKGAEDCAMVVKGVEMAPYEYRAYKDQALSGALNAGDTAEGSPEPMFLADQEGIGKWAKEVCGTESIPLPPSYEKMAVVVWDFENRSVAADMLGMCKWITWAVTPSLEIWAQLFSLATGRNTSEVDLLFCAQRTKTLERAFNVRKGIRRADDTLPNRLFETAVPGMRFKGERLERDKFDKMLDEYYTLRRWDEDGIPTEEALEEFGLSSE